MPVPRRAVPFGALAHLYTQRVFGDLVSIVLADGRQYRSHDACISARPRRPPWYRPAGPELFDTSRTMLGASQEAWLGDQLRQSRARWKLLAQGHADGVDRPGSG
jgi:alkaline phosphatase D